MPHTAAFGEDVTFTITVKNMGNEPLENVLVTDALLGGDITADFSMPGPDAGRRQVYSASSPNARCEEDPVKNSVTAVGYGTDSEVRRPRTRALCETDHPRAGDRVVKSCPKRYRSVRT